jgi:hypothetical protein
MSQQQRREFRALRRTVQAEIRGQAIEYSKLGVLGLTEHLSRNEHLAGLVERLIEVTQKAKGKPDGADVAKAFKGIVDDMSSGDKTKVVLDLLGTLPAVVKDILADSFVAIDDDERAGFRDLLDDLGLSELFDQVAAWVSLNLPEAYSPFVKASAGLLVRIDHLASSLANVSEAITAPAEAA